MKKKFEAILLEIKTSGPRTTVEEKLAYPLITRFTSERIQMPVYGYVFGEDRFYNAMTTKHHLYIVSKDPIKIGDYFINKDGLWKCSLITPSFGKKVIATSNTTIEAPQLALCSVREWCKHQDKEVELELSDSQMVHIIPEKRSWDRSEVEMLLTYAVASMIVHPGIRSEEMKEVQDRLDIWMEENL